MFGNVALSAIAHNTCGYDNKIYLCNTSTAINLDDHGECQTRFDMDLDNGRHYAHHILEKPSRCCEEQICSKNRRKLYGSFHPYKQAFS